MQILSTSVIHYPRERVFRAYRDEMSAVVPFMPNIEAINVQHRVERPGGHTLHNEWVGKTEIPRAARGIVSRDMLKWDDHAEWDTSTWSCQWEIKPRVFTESVKCKGITRMMEEGPNATRVSLAGTMDISLRNVPGIPRLFAGRLAPVVEKFIIAMITPNLEQVNASLTRYLDASEPAPR